MAEQRCIVCDCPIIDHVPFRYWWKAWCRHRIIPVVGFILGHLPLGNEPDW
ncbi:hypothetical protein EV580_1299 [Mycobacterium sp. BK086]|uniref:hypothetical protein n=1 Tax=Mycobacterium sp. BK086 TaxID=2512165 RepID=UPI0010E72CC9|nr:hypothetical protein [Mycobacterium sp. BK086]TDO18117.1 hypothetical protein EV580_1299 [Mycobacterium sp. BK086]